MRSLFLLAAMAVAYAQPPAFEVVSIRPSPPDAGSTVGSRGGPGTKNPGMWTCQNRSLYDLVWIAFNLRSQQLVAPEWMGEPRFIIQAKIPEGTTRDQFYQMLQNMLVERFGLKFHRDEKEVQGYQLVVAKNGPKFKESGPEAPKEATPSGGSRPGVIGPTPLGPDGFPVVPPGVSGSWMSFNRARDQWLRTSMQKFATQLDYHVGKPVVDATGLKGTYDLFLHWVPDQDLPDASGPTIFAALQDQLGLKLEPKKVVVPIVIVDHAEKVPTEN